MDTDLTTEEKTIIKALKKVKIINAVEVSKVIDLNTNDIAMLLISLYGKGYIKKGSSGFYLAKEPIAI